MPEHANFRPLSFAPFLDQLREVIARSRAILSEPPPDTFLGRRTQEPFPEQAPSPDNAPVSEGHKS